MSVKRCNRHGGTDNIKEKDCNFCLDEDFRREQLHAELSREDCDFEACFDLLGDGDIHDLI